MTYIGIVRPLKMTVRKITERTPLCKKRNATVAIKKLSNYMTTKYSKPTMEESKTSSKFFNLISSNIFTRYRK
ncbi:unnamed protein product [Prunus brigantina]